jgi:hypothetical protein
VRARFALPLIVVALVTACPTTTVTPVADDRGPWELVLGDSYFTIDASGDTVGTRWAELVQDDLDIEVTVDHRMVGSERAAALLERLQQDDDLRARIGDADAVFFDIPLGEVGHACGVAATRGPDELATCVASQLEVHEELTAAIMDEIVALRSPDEAIVRTGDTWQYDRSLLVEEGVAATVTEDWQELNRHVIDAATERGIPVVRAYETLSPAGGPDPVEAGYVASNGLHLTEEGAQRLAELFLETGYAPRR